MSRLVRFFLPLILLPLTLGLLSCAGGGGNSSTGATSTAPSLTSFDPTLGPVGTSVVIQGTAFTGASHVAFGSTDCPDFSVNSDTQITATVPSGANSSVISITTPGGTGLSSTTFTVPGTPSPTPPPTASITFNPTLGPVGASVVITGTAFSGATHVVFGGVESVFKVDSSTQITATVPSGAPMGAATLSVTTPDGARVSATLFTVLNPISATVINVRNAPYSAVGDGKTDDTDAIQNAVNAAGTNDTVFIPSGTYRVKAFRDQTNAYGILLKKQMTLRLDPGATLVAIPNASGLYAIILAKGVDHINIIGGTLKGDFLNGHTDTGGQWGEGISIYNSNHLVIKDVKAQNCWGDGFYVSVSCTDIQFCQVIADTNRRSGMSVTSVDRMGVYGSTFSNSAGYTESSVFNCGSGMDVEPNANETVKVLTIMGCTFSGNFGSGFSSGEKSTAIPMSNIIFDNNQVTGNGLNPTSGTRGIWLTSVGASGFRIRNNTVRGNHGIGIHLVSSANNTIVTGNTVTGTLAKSKPSMYGGGEGIMLESTLGNTITGNVVTGNAGCGIRDATPTGTNAISSNTVSGNGTCP